MEAIYRGVFLMLCVSSAGVCQVLWLRTRASQRLQQPIDMGLTLRGRRLFGENKTLRGFVVMVPATGLSFWLWSSLIGPASWLWERTPGQLAAVGLAAGLGFMLGELPNSALKRQLDIAPGEAPANPWLKRFCLLLDRSDSILGAMVAVSLCLDVSPLVWAVVLVLGPGIHGVFSFALHKVGVKRRAA